MGEDPVDPLGRPDVLPERGDVVVAEHRRVERVAATIRERRGVSGLPVVLDPHLRDRDDLHAAQIGARGMDHHRCVDVVERSRVGELDLAAPTLLRGRAEDDDAAADLVGHRGGGDPGTDARAGDDVVPACVTDAGQRVVLAQHGDRGPRRAGPCLKGGVDAARTTLDRQPFALEQPAQQVVGEVLLVVELGVLVDLVRRVDQHVSPLADLVGQSLFHRCQVSHRGDANAGARSCRAGRRTQGARAPSGSRRDRTLRRPAQAGRGR